MHEKDLLIDLLSLSLTQMLGEQNLLLTGFSALLESLINVASVVTQTSVFHPFLQFNFSLGLFLFFQKKVVQTLHWNKSLVNLALCSVSNECPVNVKKINLCSFTCSALSRLTSCPTSASVCVSCVCCSPEIVQNFLLFVVQMTHRSSLCVLCCFQVLTLWPSITKMRLWSQTSTTIQSRYDVLQVCMYSLFQYTCIGSSVNK